MSYHPVLGRHMDVVIWLRSLGLGKYEAVFRENEIDETVLPNLTAEDLRELGVTALGHRRKLLDAIAALRNENGADGPPGDLKTTPNAPSISPEDRAERRQVTVMFSDIVGSTALSARIDPEDLREIISAYQKCVAETVGHFDGLVAKYMGDGALIYFGYPTAHEDDAERAVRAGLELVTAVSALRTDERLQTRVGIATGLVVVGDLYGSGAAQEQAIVGETPNLAARLQAVAEPNTVVIAESTRKLVGYLFEFQDLGAQDLKGIAGPVRAWAALRPSSVDSRFDALRAGRFTDLVGRENELALLLEKWAKAKSGEGQVVLLSGEPGIGKSRLTVALLKRVATDPHVRLRHFCSPQYSDSAFYSIIGQMERGAKFLHDDTQQVKLNKLDALLKRTSTSQNDAALFADMLTLQNDGRYPPLELTPEQRRERTFAALRLQIEKLTGSRPVLMILEDAHWADPTSLEAFGHTVDQIVRLPVLLVVTFRPEFVPPWSGQSHVDALAIERLSDRDVVAIIDRVDGNKLLPPKVRQDIIERTDGIPLFVEEMTKAALEAEIEATAPRTSPASLPALAVPASLHGSLLARLDRVGSAKEIAQVGAALGRKFSYPLLAAVVHKPKAELASALEDLVAAGLLFQQGVPPHATYLFKHALVQDAAYGTLLRVPRRALHARITETFKTQFAEIAENQPELLARHCAEAGLIEQAASLWGKAGQRSLDHSAFVEAAAQITRAIDQITALPATPASRSEQIRLQVALITPVIHVKGYAAPETKAAADKARLLIQQAQALGETIEDQLLLFSALYGVWGATYVAFDDGDVVRKLAAEFMTLAEKQGATVPLLIGHRIMGISLFWTGEIAEARKNLDRAVALYRPREHRPLATRFGHDPGVASLINRAFALWSLGYPNAALEDADNAVKNARELDQASTLMYALSNATWSHISCGNYEMATALVQQLLPLAQEKRAAYWTAFALINQGCLWALTGSLSDGVTTLSSGIAAWRSTGANIWTPFFISRLARAYAELGNFQAASRCIKEATQAVKTTKERWCEADIYRIAGEIALISPERDAVRAEEYFERALTVARQQKARSWELRAAMSLARLWRDQGKVSEARQLLAPVYGWFTEGVGTRDLRGAKVLLADLAAEAVDGDFC
jgi:class 3 adenylate cyclase/predicted ATPase